MKRMALLCLILASMYLVQARETNLDLNQPLKEVTAQFKALSWIQQQAEIATISNNQIANAQKMAEALKEMRSASTKGYSLSQSITPDELNAMSRMQRMADELANVDISYSEWSDKLQNYMTLVKEATWLTDAQRNSALSFAGAADKLRRSIEDGEISLRALIRSLRVSKSGIFNKG